MCRTDRARPDGADKAERGAGTHPRSGSRLCDITVAVMFVLFVIGMFTGVL